MTTESLSDLQTAVERLHQCSATYKKTVYVGEDFEGKTAWEGSVSIFSVDHSETDTCYAWSSLIEGSDRRRFYVVLGKPPINSAADAVRASIVADYKE